MITFFNILLLEQYAVNDSDKFMALFKYHVNNSIPISKYTKYKPSPVSLNGSSFIINSAPLFDSNNIDILHKVQYVRLCARRDFGLYKAYSIISLDLSLFPDIDIKKLKTNPLLEIVGNQINFKYER